MHTRSALAVVLMSGCAVSALADPPPGFYDLVTGTTGPAIKSQLTTLTNQAITRSYGEARTLLQDIDEDPANPSNIILTYTGVSIDSTWTSGNTWNREHTWPRSLGVGSSGSDNSDLHMLRPCNPGVNSERGNKRFGTAAGEWDPDWYGQEFRGEMARVVFYANTRYTYLSIPTIGSQSQFIDWHFEQMPDDDDRRRNDRAFDAQQNRNPFVDRPEWVWAIFGEGPSDAQLAIAGAGVTGGASAASIDLGALIADGAPITTGIALDKTGAAPTTYLVSADGGVSSAAATGHQAGFARGPGSVDLPITLDATPGPVEGTITIDNTDLTSAGAGFGSADGDDVVLVTAFVFEPSVASLDSAEPLASTAIDLGQIAIGESSGPVSIAVWNLAPGVTGAALDVDSVQITGLADGVSIVGAPVVGVLPGDAATLTLDVSPTAAGVINATAIVAVSDEDLPGETASTLTLSILAEAVDPCPADVNSDGVADESDFFAWVSAFGSGAPECDVNGDGACEPGDFFAWVSAFNEGC
ncbi:MAG: endonuclease [Planctomycetota bacterium]